MWQYLLMGFRLPFPALGYPRFVPPFALSSVLCMFMRIPSDGNIHLSIFLQSIHSLILRLCIFLMAMAWFLNCRLVYLLLDSVHSHSGKLLQPLVWWKIISTLGFVYKNIGNARYTSVNNVLFIKLRHFSLNWDISVILRLIAAFYRSNSSPQKYNFDYLFWWV
jgi:hypothetical protein